MKIITPKMAICDSSENIIISKSPNKIINHFCTKKEIILCKHCKRTASNGIRCLGMCVADNDY